MDPLVNTESGCLPWEDLAAWMPIVCRQAMLGYMSEDDVRRFVRGARAEQRERMLALELALDRSGATLRGARDEERDIVERCALLRFREIASMERSLDYLERYVETGSLGCLRQAREEHEAARVERHQLLLHMRRILGLRKLACVVEALA